MNITRRRFLKTGGITILAAAGTPLFFSGCSDTKSQSTDSGRTIIKVGYLPITHSWPLFVLMEKYGSEMKKARIEPVKFTSWPDLTEALNAGKLQAAITMFEIVLASRIKGLPIEILALSHRNGDFITSSLEINGLEDLRGRTVAIPHRLSGHNILLYKALKDKGIPYSEVRVREMPPPDMPAALASGEIAAYVVAEPFGSQSVLNGKGKILISADSIWPNWTCCGVAATTDMITANEEPMREFIRYFVRAGKDIQTDPGMATAAAQKYTGVKKKYWKQALTWTNYSDLKPDAGELAMINDYLVEMGVLHQKVNVNEIIRGRFAEEFEG